MPNQENQMKGINIMQMNRYKAVMLSLMFLLATVGCRENKSSAIKQADTMIEAKKYVALSCEDIVEKLCALEPSGEMRNQIEKEGGVKKMAEPLKRDAKMREQIIKTVAVCEALKSVNAHCEMSKLMIQGNTWLVNKIKDIPLNELKIPINILKGHCSVGASIDKSNKEILDELSWFFGLSVFERETIATKYDVCLRFLKDVGFSSSAAESGAVSLFFPTLLTGRGYLDYGKVALNLPEIKSKDLPFLRKICRKMRLSLFAINFNGEPESNAAHLVAQCAFSKGSKKDLEILSDKLEYIVKMVDKEKDLKKKKSVALKLLLELWSQEPVLKQR